MLFRIQMGLREIGLNVPESISCVSAGGQVSRGAALLPRMHGSSDGLLRIHAGNQPAGGVEQA